MKNLRLFQTSILSQIQKIDAPVLSLSDFGAISKRKIAQKLMATLLIFFVGLAATFSFTSTISPQANKYDDENPWKKHVLSAAIDSKNVVNKGFFTAVETGPKLESCKIDRATGVLVLTFKNLEINSSDVEITLRTNTGERLTFTANNYDKGDEIFTVPIAKDKFLGATSIEVVSVFSNVFTQPEKILLEKIRTEITTH